MGDVEWVAEGIRGRGCRGRVVVKLEGGNVERRHVFTPAARPVPHYAYAWVSLLRRDEVHFSIQINR